MKRVLFFLLAIIFAIQGWTQDVQIGTGTATQGYIPVNAYYGYTYSQQIIKASEISASGTVLTGGTITKIRYYWTGTYNFNNSTQWKVYLGHTTKTSFTSTSDWVIDTSMTVVFDGNITAPTSAGWFTIYLTTPFVYNGTNNLVIAVDENMPSYNLTGAIAYNSYTSTNCGLYYYSDPTNPNPASPPTGTRGSNVPQVKLYFAEACGVASPESPSIITFNPSDATINWALGGLETQWNLQYKLTTDVNWTPIQSITTKPYQLTSLSPNSNYQFQVQSNCGSGVVSGWSDTLSFTTPAIPTQLPFTTNFENATDNSNWQFINGTQVNKWYVGQAIDVLTGLPVDTLGSTKSLYIAGNATGDTNMYLGGSSANVSRVYALRDFFIPSGTAEVSLEFDWRANGNDATTDFLRVYLVPTTATITAGAIPLGGLDASAMIGNYTGGVGQHWLSKKTSWQHAKFRITETQFPLLANNTWRLLVHWRNENTAGTAQPPAAVDNMSINVITCPAPITFATSNPTVNSVDLSWVEKGTATAWNVYYKNINSTVWSMVTATTNPYTLTGLNPSSTYQVKIQASCATDTSYMTGIVNFNTVCAPITAYPWKEGFESTWATAVLPGNDAIPGNCWINVNGGASTSYKWRKSTSISIPAYQRTGTGSAQLYGYNQSMGDYLITPTFTLTGAEKINFYGKGYSTTSNYPENIWVKAYNETLYGAFDSITDTVYFTDLLFINDTNKYTWNEYEIPLTNLVGDYRFVFARNNNVGYYYHIDDLEIDYQGSCPRPTVASVANIQAMQADISWTSASVTDVAWKIFYRPVGTPNWDSVTVTANPYTLTNLLPNTAYEIEVKTDCGNGGFSDGRATSFRSACAPITVVPHFENFDSYGSGSFAYWHPCWYRFSTYSPTTYPFLNSTNYSSPASVYFFAYGAGKFNIVASPKIDTTINPINTLRVKFKMRRGGTSYPGVEVGIMSNPADTTTFVQIGNIINTTTTNVWEDKEVSFASFTGSGSYIAFKCTATASATTNTFYIDDVEILTIPPCAKPTAVTATNILANQADISWLNGQPTDNAWRIFYKSLTTGTWDSVSVTTNPYTLVNLTPATKYEVYIKTDCGYTMSEGSFSYTFQTPCLPITSLPWNEGFEGITTTNELPVCWAATNLGTYTYTQTSDYTSYNRYAHSGTKSAYFRYGVNDAFYGPGFSLVAGTTYTFSYWYITDGLSGWNSLSAGVYSGQNDASFIQNVGNPVLTPNNTTYKQYIGIFTPTTNGIYYFGVKCQATSSPFYITIDDFSLGVYNCNLPDSVDLTNVMPTSVDMNWNAGTATSWQVEYKKSDSTLWTKALVNTNTYTFIGLSPQTKYDFRVAGLCNGAVDTSMFVVLSIKTPCLPISTIPYAENFDNYGIGTGTYPTCWTKFSQYSAIYPYINSSYSSSPSGSLYFYSYNNQQTYAIFGPIDNSISMDTLRVKFKMYYSSLGIHNIQVGVMTDPSNITTFVPVDNVQSVTVASTWNDKEVSLVSYTGTGRYIAFKTLAPANTYNYGYIDDVVVDYIPACAKPTNLAISNITTTTADLSWTNGNTNNTAWWLYTKLASATSFDSILITSASPYTIINLLPSSQYNYYMKTSCPAAVSEPTPVFSFYTACAPISTFPWYEGFEATWLPMIGVSNDAQPSCWININGGASTTYKWRKTTSTGIGYIRTGTGSAQLYAYNNAMGDYLITPTFTLTGNQKIIFWAKGYSSSTSYPENIWVKAFDETTNGTLDSISDTTLFTNIGFINDTNQYTWKEYEFPLTGLVGNYRLVFARDNNVGYYFHIDDLKVDNQGACPRPTTASATNIQAYQADITWTPGTATDNAWKVFYRPMGSLTWDSIYTTSNPYTLTNLIASTSYEVEIKTDCGTGAFSDGRGVSFMTLCGVMAIPTAIESFVTVLPNICWASYSGQLPSTGNATLTTSTGGWVANSSVTPHNIKVNIWTTNQYYWLVTPSIDLAAGSSSNKLEFDIFLTAYNNANAPNLSLGYADKKFYVLISTDDGLTWSASKTMKKWDNAGSVDTLNKLTNVPLHVTIPIVDTANNPYSGVVKFAFYGESTVSSVGDNDLHIDNFQVTGQVCAAPTALTTSGITQTAATVSWTPGASETSWEVKLGSAGATTTVTSPTYTFTNLTAATQYTAYVRANCGTSNSVWVPVTFTTNSAPLAAVVTTAPVTTITYNTASLVGSYVAGADTINAVGFEYKTTASITWTTQTVSPVASPFSYNATGLTSSTQYKVRAFVTKQGGVNVYGDTVTFTTGVFSLPTVITDSIVVLNNSSAKFYGSITIGTEQIVARGFEFKTAAQIWSSAQDLTATGTNSITATATGLDTTTTYNVRAYAETGSGKIYGDEKNFVTTSGLNDIEIKQIEVSLYPNPASTTSTLVVKGLVGEAKVIITDVQGRTINTFTMKSINGEATKSINVNEFAKGVYYLRIQNVNTISIQKLIIR